MEYRQSIVQEAEQVLKTKFWSLFINKLAEKQKFCADRFYGDKMFSQVQWVKHVWYQGQLEAINNILRLPDEIINELKQRGD